MGSEPDNHVGRPPTPPEPRVPPPVHLEHEFVKRKSLVLLNANRLGRDQQTLVITGQARGGTSIVSYIYRRAGFYLGEKLSPDNHEDTEIRKALFTRQFDDLVERRNTRPRWGFKAPYVLSALAMLEVKLRNPVFIICYRNPIAIARSIVRHDPDYKTNTQNLLSALDRAIQLQAVARHQFNVLRSPIALVDVDMAKQQPAVFVTEILELMSIKPVASLRNEIATEISTRGYKLVTDFSPS